MKEIEIGTLYCVRDKGSLKNYFPFVEQTLTESYRPVLICKDKNGDDYVCFRPHANDEDFYMVAVEEFHKIFKLPHERG